MTRVIMTEPAAHHQQHEGRQALNNHGLDQPADTGKKDYKAERDENLGKSLENLEGLVICSSIVFRHAARAIPRGQVKNPLPLIGGDDPAHHHLVEMFRRQAAHLRGPLKSRGGMAVASVVAICLQVAGE